MLPIAENSTLLPLRSDESMEAGALPSLFSIAVNSTLLQKEDALPSSLPAAVNSTLLPLLPDESKGENAVPPSPLQEDAASSKASTLQPSESTEENAAVPSFGDSARATLDAARTCLENLLRDPESGASEAKSELSSLVNELDVAG